MHEIEQPSIDSVVPELGGGIGRHCRHCVGHLTYISFSSCDECDTELITYIALQLDSTGQSRFVTLVSKTGKDLVEHISL